MPTYIDNPVCAYVMHVRMQVCEGLTHTESVAPDTGSGSAYWRWSRPSASSVGKEKEMTATGPSQS